MGIFVRQHQPRQRSFGRSTQPQHAAGKWEANTSSISSLQTTQPGKLLVKGDRDRLSWAAMLLHTE
ncbi:hypothetical protein ACSS6W_007096 [Trichoderma asperelloides]